MSIAFPLQLDAFASRIKVAPNSGAFTITPNATTTGLGNGQVLTSELFPPVWQVSVQSVPMPREVVRDLAALARVVEHKDGSFMMADYAHKFPQLDPSGALIGANIVTVSGIGGNGRSVRLTGMPPLYRMRAGDRLSIQSGDQVYYGELSESSNANASGTGPFTDVFPEMPLWVDEGAVVDVAIPAARMRIVPGSLSAEIGLINGTIAFDAIEAMT